MDKPPVLFKPMDANELLKDALNQARKGALVAFNLSQDKLHSLLTQKALIDDQIEECQRNLFQMAPLCGIDAKDPMTLLGLTDAVRYIIGSRFKLACCTTADILNALTEARFKLPESNPLAAVQTVVRRLVENEEIADISDPNDQHEPPMWQWKTPAAAPIPPIPDWMLPKKNTEETAGDSPITDDDIPF